MVWLLIAAVAGYLLSGWYEKPTEKQLRENRSTHLEDLKTARPIVFVGDSRIRGAEWAELLQMDASNRGIDGDTTKAVRDRLASAVPSDTEVCVVQVGYADLSEGRAPDEVAANLADIARAARAKRVIVTSIIPDSGQTGDVNGSIAEVNRIAPELVKKVGADWVDLSPIFGTELTPDLRSDDVSLNGTGYRKLAELIKPRLH